MFTRSPLRLAAAAILLLCLLCASQGCQNVPSHRKIMRYHRHEEIAAARQIADLRAKYEAGEITQAAYQSRAKAIIDEAPEKAMDGLFRDYLLSTQTAPAPPAR